MIKSIAKTIAQSAVRAAYARLPQPKTPSAEHPTLSPIAFGTGNIHGLYRRLRIPRGAQVEAVLDAAFENGCNAFDTARVYGGGLSERLVGKWIRSRRIRDRVVLIAKGGHPDSSWNSRLHGDALRQDLDRSLRTLGVDHVDFYLLHRDDPGADVGPIMETLHSFVQAGKVTAIGASNWSHLRIEEANIYAAERGLTPLVISSPQFSLAEMVAPPWPGCLSIGGHHGAAARAWYAATQMPVLAWSPLAGGYLTRRGDTQSAAYANEANLERRQRLHELSSRRGVTAEQIALAYLMHQCMNVIPIAAASTPDRVREILTAADLPLSHRELEWLDLRSDRQISAA